VPKPKVWWELLRTGVFGFCLKPVLDVRVVVSQYINPSILQFILDA